MSPPRRTLAIGAMMEIVVNIAGWVVAALTLFLMFHQHRLSEKRLAEATKSQRAAEQQLADARSRGEGPFLSPSNELCSHIYEQTAGNILFWSITGTNVLWADRQEVSDLKHGDPVILLLHNSGQDARRIVLTTELANCTIKQEPEFDSSHGYIFLKYDFAPEHFGKTFTVELSFESPSGFQDTHIYETVHGKRVFKRVKPA